MADLVTRLILDNKQFNDNIQKSKKEVKQFEGVTNTISTGLSKFAGAIGAAYSAGEVFNQMMQNSQTFGDTMTSTINAAKDSVNEFFYSLGTGDFSSFLNGIENIISSSREATAALDQLGNTRMAYDYARSQDRRNIAEARTTANNTDLSTGEREQGFKQWGAALEELKKNAGQYRSDALNAAQQLAEKGTLIDNASLKNIDFILKLDIQNAQKRTAEKKKLAEQYTKYEQGLSDITAKYNLQKVRSNSKTQTEAIKEKERLEKLNWAKQNERAIMYNNLLNKFNDNELNNLYQLINEAENANEELGSQIEEYNNAFRTFNKEKNSGDSTNVTSKSTIKVEPKLEEGSIAFIDEQLSRLKKEFNLAINNESRLAILTEIEALTKQKHYIDLDIKYSKPSEEITDKPKNDLKDIQETFKKMGKFEIPSFINIGTKDNEGNSNKLEAWKSSLNSITNIMGNLSNMTNEGAAAWLNWIGNLASAVSAAIPLITLLTDAKQRQAFMAAIASAAETPLVGWLLVGAAAATVLSAMATMPAFASGGIVGGNSFSGDNNIIRVNSGEMILNKRQQGNLFNMLDNGANGSSNSNNVRFVIKGTELVGVLNNYNKKMAKVR